MTAGGGVTSVYDPLDATQYTLDEMKAAVAEAERWGTYVMVHAHSDDAINRAIDAGVKCIDHGRLMKNKGRIQVDKDADITIFDLETIKDNSTMKGGGLPYTGIPFA